MTIRSAKQKDLKEIQSLMDELNNLRRDLFSKKNSIFHQRIKPYAKLKAKDIKSDLFFVAENDNTIVGYIWGSIDQRKSHKLYKLGYVDELYILKTARTKGYAKKLFRTLIKAFKEKGCDHMTTHTDIENTIAQSFYETNGMNKTTIEYWKKI